MSTLNQEPYAQATELLRQQAQATDGPDLSELAEEILAFAGILVAQPKLRRALASPTRPAEDRVRLLRTLVAGRVAEPCLDLLCSLVSGRWSSSSRLLDATEHLGVDAVLYGAQRADQLATIEDELFRFERIVDGDRELATALGASSVPVERRSTLVRDLLGERVLPVTTQLVEIALAGFGGRGFAASLGRLVELVAEHRSRAIAYVTTAVPLDTEQEQRLTASLKQRYGTSISLKVEVDPAVLGGVRVRLGSDLYDGTVARRIAQARAAMLW